MFAVVAFGAHHELVIVLRKLQCGGHLAVRQRPATVEVVEVVAAFLQENSNRLLFRFTDDGRVDVTATNSFIVRRPVLTP